ncbi:Protein RADIALIS-like 6 [Glycine max]|nr:Protein RADIALIS-like 6 [Glycine max]
MGWTREENRRFEDALAVHGPDDPNRWQHVANAVGGKSVQEVKMHYEILQEDVIRIERDQIPLPSYRGNERQIHNEQRVHVKFNPSSFKSHAPEIYWFG